MKPCAGHSSDLLERIRKRGLGFLIKPEAAGRFTTRWLAGKATPEELDPYVVAVLEIYAKAERSGVPHHYEGCALCAMNRVYRRPDAAERVIAGVTDMVHQLAKTNGLIH